MNLSLAQSYSRGFQKPPRKFSSAASSGILFFFFFFFSPPSLGSRPDRTDPAYAVLGRPADTRGQKEGTLNHTSAASATIPTLPLRQHPSHGARELCPGQVRYVARIHPPCAGPGDQTLFGTSQCLCVSGWAFLMGLRHQPYPV
ncbi:hypothetical protein F5X98DRAFT_344050 [Xylaria grammica]|nr:hypothetical protein F5X98DRAFT_344050 [Xylaria grammica]